MLLDYLHFYHFVLALFVLQIFIVLRLRRKFMEQDQLLANLQKEVEALRLNERGIADSIQRQQSQLLSMASRQDKLEINENTRVNYKQAIALMKKGASTDELVEACDISRGEVELISHMQRLWNNPA